MLAIRLQRMGKKKVPTYRLIVSPKTQDTHDVYTELLGTYNPHAKENQFQPKADRVLYWISQGAQTSDTVHNLLVTAGIIKGDKKKSVFLSKKRHAKVDEKKSAAAKALADKKAAEEKAAADQAAAEQAAKDKAEAEKAAAAEAAAAPAAEAAPAESAPQA